MHLHFLLPPAANEQELDVSHGDEAAHASDSVGQDDLC